jgi:hypothetical protein
MAARLDNVKIQFGFPRQTQPVIGIVIPNWKTFLVGSLFPANGLQAASLSGLA